MCGIVGTFCFTDKGRAGLSAITEAVKSLSQRGPDSSDIYVHHNIAIGHSRLSIIDVTSAASQPFTDDSGRYTIVFNGEFYNYAEHRNQLLSKGIKLRSGSDTEVLLHLFMLEGPQCIYKVNGDFAFAVYDKQKEELVLMRDRAGVKPITYYLDSDRLVFASEMKALFKFNIKKELDYSSLLSYFQLNYIPQPYSVFRNVQKLIPGEYLTVNSNGVTRKKYYSIEITESRQTSPLSYEDACKSLYSLLDESVKRRLVSDVPLGAFLSGGVDSSVITALASKHVGKLNTFSIGYKNEPFFDETSYAEAVAKKCNTNHTVFSLTNDDLFSVLFKVLDYIDEPFADSSALAVNILSYYTRQKVTVALSGDGADEMFAGYNKHKAHYRALNSGIIGAALKTASPILNMLPQSRNSRFGNKLRQAARFADGLSLSDADRYWRWCSFVDEKQAKDLLLITPDEEYLKRKTEAISEVNHDDLNSILLSDMRLVLQGDMLTKVDLMSMANSLEVRVPFLDYTVMDFAFSLPFSYKFDGVIQKKILQDTFRPYLPESVYNRPKHGFEVPLLKWFRKELKTLITEDLLSDTFIKEQGVFNASEIKKIKEKLFSSNPGEIHARVWGLIVFQYWWRKYYK